MIRLFLPPETLASRQTVITGEQARHLSLVLRVSVGDILSVFDGLGNLFTCRVLNVRKKEVTIEQIKKEPYSVESPVSVFLAQGIPKGEKMDFIIQKTTELGVKKIIPIITGRSQVQHTHKVDRWRKIAISASKQSGRDTVPYVEEPAGFEEFIARQDSGNRIILYEEEKNQSLRRALGDYRRNSDITLLAGPEGGFSKHEISSALHGGFTSVSLGPRILRSETAPIAALSIIQYELGDI